MQVDESSIPEPGSLSSRYLTDHGERAIPNRSTGALSNKPLTRPVHGGTASKTRTLVADRVPPTTGPLGPVRPFVGGRADVGVTLPDAAVLSDMPCLRIVEHFNNFADVLQRASCASESPEGGPRVPASALSSPSGTTNAPASRVLQRQCAVLSELLIRRIRAHKFVDTTEASRKTLTDVLSTVAARSTEIVHALLHHVHTNVGASPTLASRCA